MVSAIGGLILALIATFKPNTAPVLAIPYALFEGAFLGGNFSDLQVKFPGVPLQALLATFITTLVMFALYLSKLFGCLEKFKAVVLSASIAIAIVFVVQSYRAFGFWTTFLVLFLKARNQALLHLLR